jgi:hypothetical protein
VSTVRKLQTKDLLGNLSLRFILTPHFKVLPSHAIGCSDDLWAPKPTVQVLEGCVESFNTSDESGRLIVPSTITTNLDQNFDLLWQTLRSRLYFTLNYSDRSVWMHPLVEELIEFRKFPRDRSGNPQGDRKVTQPIPDTCFICKKINYIEIRKQCGIWVGKNIHRVQRCMHLLFSSCLMQPDEEFLCHGNGLPDEILSICLAQENREMYPWTHSGKLSKNEMSGSVRQWTLVALVKKTSLHLDCWKTTDGLARAGYNMTWPAWALV